MAWPKATRLRVDALECRDKPTYICLRGLGTSGRTSRERRWIWYSNWPVAEDIDPSHRLGHLRPVDTGLGDWRPHPSFRRRDQTILR